jgi:hypothetical protein
MTDPSRWQYPPPYPPHHQHPHPQPPPAQQQQYRSESNGYDPSFHSPPQLPQLRPLQPNPYPQPTGYPIYPYPQRNSPQLEESEQEKADNRRTRISRAW